MLNETRAAAKELALKAIPGPSGPGGSPPSDLSQLSDGALDLSLVLSFSSRLCVFFCFYRPKWRPLPQMRSLEKQLQHAFGCIDAFRGRPEGGFVVLDS